MDLDSRNFILKLLNAIDYQDDKEAFINQFMGVVQVQSISDLISTLPADQQEAAKSKLFANKDNPEKIAGVLKARFSEEQMQKSLEEAIKNAVVEWMQAVSSTLSDQQKQKLVDLSQEFAPQAAAPSTS